MNRLVRVTVGSVATALSASLAGSIQPVDSVPLQKSPIAVPATAILPATMPLQKDPWGKIPTVVVSLDESRQEPAAIATGMNANVVSLGATTRLKLAAVQGRVKIDALDSSSTAGQTEVQRFRAATLELTNLTFAVGDVPAMLSPHPHPEAPGAWLGTPFLSAFQVTLNPPTNLVGGSVVLKKSTAPLDHRKETSVVPMVLRDNRPYVQVAVPGTKPFLALVDTMSPGTVIPSDVGEKLKLKPIRVETFSRIEGKVAKAALVELPKLSIGKTEWKAARVYFLTSESSKEYDRNFAVIGMDFIGRFRFTLDFARAKIALGPPDKPAEATAKPDADN